MLRDELSIPLQRQRLHHRLWSKRPSALAMAYALSLTGFAVAGTWAFRTPLPYAGEPVIVAGIPAPEEIITASIDPKPESLVETVTEEPVDDPDAMATADDSNATEEFATGAVPDEPQADEGVEQVGRRRATIIKVEEAPRQDTYKQASGNIIISTRRPLTTAPVKAISETTPDGILPKVGQGGNVASSVYARTTPLSIIHSEAPKIAIILGGMGISNKLTSRAIKDLPADITLAFAPYGQDLQTQVNAARGEGHEVFLQVPLEPVGFPATNPGPKTLQTEQTEEDNIASLHWHMSRFAGYAGVVNYMGGRFLTNEASSRHLLGELRKRGLLFVEDGSVPLSASEGIANSLRLKMRKAHSVIDANPNQAAIMDALRKLEQEAELNGVAIGSGSGLAITIETLSEWIKDASSRGIVIIPASAAFKGRTG
jgi:uncharacterized protein